MMEPPKKITFFSLMLGFWLRSTISAEYTKIAIVKPVIKQITDFGTIDRGFGTW